jgi:Fis family transcriptional regulator
MNMNYRAVRGTPKESMNVAKRTEREPLAACVRDAIDTYFEQLNGHTPNNLHALVVAEVERPLFECVMRQTGGNQSRAAEVLGISRSTLRKKLALYSIV